MITLSKLARLVQGTLLGDGNLQLRGASTLDCAGPGEIAFLDAADKAHRLARSHAAAVLVPHGFVPEGMPAIQVSNVHAAFAAVVSHFRPVRQQPRRRVSIQAIVAWTARLGDDVYIGPGASIGEDVVIGNRVTIHSGARILPGCRIADDVTIFPNAVLYEDTIVGARSIIHAGASIGAYGFGYKLVGGQHQLSSQLGFVEIGSDVEVGANTTIDRGTYSATVIGDGTKIDNLVMIAHNCRIGRHNMICSQVGIAGSTTTGDYVVMAGQVGVRDHVHIGSGAVLGAMAGVANDVPENAHMLGAPAVPEREQKLMFATMSKLPEMRKQLKELTRQMAELTGGDGQRQNHAA
ncbi:MAG: UDP-3-O-(3-hydroxymyristoyl)glucosamine N-acyltransferase [Planctomycetota bacterium]|nr:UDP-3-O-(3-hydroxymyristoyl)glucosamine N-acyltransferase [Planctomycetota bacterium]